VPVRHRRGQAVGMVLVVVLLLLLLTGWTGLGRRPPPPSVASTEWQASSWTRGVPSPEHGSQRSASHHRCRPQSAHEARADRRSCMRQPFLST
jgi:hypothetical protein